MLNWEWVKLEKVWQYTFLNREWSQSLVPTGKVFENTNGPNHFSQEYGFPGLEHSFHLAEGHFHYSIRMLCNSNVQVKKDLLVVYNKKCPTIVTFGLVLLVNYYVAVKKIHLKTFLMTGIKKHILKLYAKSSKHKNSRRGWNSGWFFILLHIFYFLL